MGAPGDDAVLIQKPSKAGEPYVITVNCPDKTGLGCDICRTILDFGLYISKGGIIDAVSRVNLSSVLISLLFLRAGSIFTASMLLQIRWNFPYLPLNYMIFRRSVSIIICQLVIPRNVAVKVAIQLNFFMLYSVLYGAIASVKRAENICGVLTLICLQRVLHAKM